MDDRQPGGVGGWLASSAVGTYQPLPSQSGQCPRNISHYKPVVDKLPIPSEMDVIEAGRLARVPNLARDVGNLRDVHPKLCAGGKPGLTFSYPTTLDILRVELEWRQPTRGTDRARKRLMKQLVHWSTHGQLVYLGLEGPQPWTNQNME
jgi:hypothetical protein